METHKRNKKNPFIFWESYIGAIVGFIVALQIDISRMRVTGELQTADCTWTPPFGLACSQLALLIIMVLIIAGFIIGWWLKIMQLKKHEKNIPG